MAQTRAFELGCFEKKPEPGLYSYDWVRPMTEECSKIRDFIHKFLEELMEIVLKLEESCK